MSSVCQCGRPEQYHGHPSCPCEAYKRSAFLSGDPVTPEQLAALQVTSTGRKARERQRRRER